MAIIKQSRREFLSASAAAVASAAIAAPSSTRVTTGKPTADAVIFLMLTGGPSQLDTWDPKPEAPSEIRGPFQPIATRVPGIQFTELFPRMAAIADQFSLLRSVHHTDAPIHEIGFQWVNTGNLFREGPDCPNVGAIAAKQLGSRGKNPAWWQLSNLQVQTGVNVSHGQGTGNLKIQVRRSHQEDLKAAARTAVHALEAGARVISINQFTTVFNAPSWDCHAAGGALDCDFRDIRNTVAPSFDFAFSELITTLKSRGLLERTLVVATGEFGRTPHLNSSGGRDHWPGCWTALMAGGGVQGGRVIGASDATASAPKERPVHARDLPATVLHALGIDPGAFMPGTPVTELFA